MLKVRCEWIARRRVGSINIFVRQWQTTLSKMLWSRKYCRIPVGVPRKPYWPSIIQYNQCPNLRFWGIRKDSRKRTATGSICGRVRETTIRSSSWVRTPRQWIPRCGKCAEHATLAPVSKWVGTTPQTPLSSHKKGAEHSQQGSPSLSGNLKHRSIFF